MHRVIAMEPRGHGRSSSPKGKYALAEMAGDIGNSRRQTEPEPARPHRARPGRAGGASVGHRTASSAGRAHSHRDKRCARRQERAQRRRRAHPSGRGGRHAKRPTETRKARGREPRGMNPKERAERHRLFLRNDASGYASAGYAELLAPDLTERLGEIILPRARAHGRERPRIPRGRSNPIHEDSPLRVRFDRRSGTLRATGQARGGARPHPRFFQETPSFSRQIDGGNP